MDIQTRTNPNEKAGKNGLVSASEFIIHCTGFLREKKILFTLT
jgi:hypothetical protein